MTRYNQSKDPTLTLTNSTIGWGIGILIALCLVFFVGGIYTGYYWGYDDGVQYARTTGQMKDAQSRSFAKWETGAGTAAESAADTGFEGSFTEEELAMGPESGTEPTQTTSAVSDDMSSTPPVRTNTLESTPASSQGSESTFSSTSPSGSFTIQAVSTPYEKRAREYANNLQEKGHEVHIMKVMIDGKQYHRVRVGSFSTREDAKNYAEEMVERGDIDDYWISKVDS